MDLASPAVSGTSVYANGLTRCFNYKGQMWRKGDTQVTRMNYEYNPSRKCSVAAYVAWTNSIVCVQYL